MADRGDTHYHVPTLNLWFLVSSLLLLISLALFACLLSVEVEEAKPTLLWRGTVHRIEADGAGLPEELGPDAKSALELWTPRAQRWGL